MPSQILYEAVAEYVFSNIHDVVMEQPVLLGVALYVTVLEHEESA